MIIFTLLLDLIITNSIFVLSIYLYLAAIEYAYLIILLTGNIAMLVNFYIFNVYSTKNIYTLSVAVLKSWILSTIIIFTLIILLEFDNIGKKALFTWLICSPVFIIITKIFILRYIAISPQDIYVFGNDYKWTSFEIKRLTKQKITLIPINDINLITDNQTVVINSKNLEISSPNIHTHYLSISYFMEHYLQKCHIETITELEHINEFSKSEKLLKFLIDCILIVILLPVLFISGFFTWFIIKIQSPGQMLFTQKRIGRNNALFTLFKFRSMHKDSHFDPYTQKNDSRIFPYGHFIRKTRIDELPQLFNIFIGNMNVIGPRAEWDILEKDYKINIKYYKLRSLVKPGITGWAQVNYPYGANLEDAKQKLMYDLYYIKNWNVSLEFEIIIKTIRIMLGKKGL